MAESESVIATAISALASAFRAEREAAASAIFRMACDEIDYFACGWMQNPEFARLVGAPSPEFTAGVVVEPELFAAIRNANDSPLLADVPPEQDAAEFHLRVRASAGIDARLEVLTTRDPSGEGAIARYLRKFGRGIQHVEMAASDVDRATEILKTQFALQPIYPAARAGADKARINFFLVTNPNGKKILVELEEEAKRS